MAGNKAKVLVVEDQVITGRAKKKRGTCGYLVKPIRAHDIASTLEAALSKQTEGGCDS